MWQAEADKELTLFALPATAVGQSKSPMANLGYNSVSIGFFHTQSSTFHMSIQSL